MTYNDLEQIMIDMLTNKQKETLVEIGKSGVIKADKADKYQVGLFQSVSLLSKVEKSLGLKKSNWYAILEPTEEE